MNQDDNNFADRNSNNETDSAKDVMREWFFQHFEDPAESTPYDSREGGYQWLRGGPYNALDELQSKFADEYSEDDIEELAEELSSECWEWAPTPSNYDDYYLDSEELLRNKAEKKFTTHMEDVIQLAGVSQSPLLNNKYRQLLYSNVIAAMEAYLTERFMQVVLTDENKLRIFVVSTPEFQDKKIPLATVFDAHDKIHDTAKIHLLETIWHNLAKVEKMFTATLNIKFPKELKGTLHSAIHNRHDIVHRNGFTKDGIEVEITEDSLFRLIAEVSQLVKHIETELTSDLDPSCEADPWF